MSGAGGREPGPLRAHNGPAGGGGRGPRAARAGEGRPAREPLRGPLSRRAVTSSNFPFPPDRSLILPGRICTLPASRAARRLLSRVARIVRAPLSSSFQPLPSRGARRHLTFSRCPERIARGQFRESGKRSLSRASQAACARFDRAGHKYGLTQTLFERTHSSKSIFDCRN